MWNNIKRLIYVNLRNYLQSNISFLLNGSLINDQATFIFQFYNRENRTLTSLDKTLIRNLWDTILKMKVITIYQINTIFQYGWHSIIDFSGHKTTLPHNLLPPPPKKKGSYGIIIGRIHNLSTSCRSGKMKETHQYPYQNSKKTAS